MAAALPPPWALTGGRDGISACVLNCCPPTPRRAARRAPVAARLMVRDSLATGRAGAFISCRGAPVRCQRRRLAGAMEPVSGEGKRRARSRGRSIERSGWDFERVRPPTHETDGERTSPPQSVLLRDNHSHRLLPSCRQVTPIICSSADGAQFYIVIIVSLQVGWVVAVML
ncbi:hypothetical protein GQ55_7G158400 [Panicum hallii var. hallii]|uniref:Uncharacterized protein n=1 Tax=Panicum hallii var. hallii TaxID=1504633 RepID=A0A2T7CVT7_9POAL|nr:hypothetical protein GQ55_7G158400 [Panicum hallii var. hallii]